ncbi:MAG: hypothetical protein H8M99_09080 [Gloeobacteraceae cyanobacterium ES-bin-144]|nr:hypothetical protein [Verrucomicrobiales bacterium]
MSKTNENILLVPGEAGWEIWTAPPESGFSLHSASGLHRASELRDMPPGELTMLFSVVSLTAVPMRVTSDDDSLFPDLAALHAERLGLRPDPMAGQLTDLFVISREPENTALLGVFLRTPVDGELPTRGPKGFDFSARAFPVEGETLAVWKEFGRWVFAVYQQGKLVYCQATAVVSPQPDESLAREIRLSLMQLEMQGLDVECSRVVVWSSDETLDLSPLKAAFKIPVALSPKPHPVLPDPLSKLLPADVRAARRLALRRRNIQLAIAAVGLIYLGLIGWYGYGLWKNSAETKNLIAQAQAAAPMGEAYAAHVAKWDELANVVELANSPVDILSRISACIPPNSGLRLKTADISASEIKLVGEAPALPAVNTFSLKLSKNSDLTRFTWQTPEPNQVDRGWDFTFTGEIPAQSQP